MEAMRRPQQGTIAKYRKMAAALSQGRTLPLLP
ncbi:hypothetical protein J2W14_001216 [Pseudarthrobacter oxydans]|nr:hypothetical protein [Pseudarthrobacter oxydans]